MDHKIVGAELRDKEARGVFPTDKHFWFYWKDDPFQSCIRCGSIRRADGKESKCRGWAKIELRN